MLRLTKKLGNESVLVNPAQIVYIEVGGGNVSNVYLARGEMVQVLETVEEIDAMIRGVSFGPAEFKTIEPNAVIEVDDTPTAAEDADEESFSIPASAFEEAEKAEEEADEPPSSGKSSRNKK